jgi:D-aminopeptidase
MRRKKSQLYVLCDMEGASQISPENRKAMHYGSELWTQEGRGFITSDVKAVCDAAIEFGIDEVILNDSHDYGHREPNVRVNELPSNVRVVRRPYLPGKPRHMVKGDLVGMVIVGMHAMHGGGGFAPHTISAPFGEVTINGIKVGEIGLELALFMGVKLLAIVGEQAAVDEAKALCPNVVVIPVKSLENDWFPATDETHPRIREGILQALQGQNGATGLCLKPPFRYTLKPADGFFFDPDKKSFLRWLARLTLFGLTKGRLSEGEASWETNRVVLGLHVLHSTRTFMRRRS